MRNRCTSAALYALAMILVASGPALGAQARESTPHKREAAASRTATPEPAADDEEALSRALERSLVVSGGVLLPKGRFEVTPALRYDYTRRSGLGIVPPSSVATRDVTRETLVGSLGAKVGLPWQSQLEVTVPYGRQSIDSVVGATPVSASETGIGDVQFGVSKQLLGENANRPSLIGNVTWNESSGKTSQVQPAQQLPAGVVPAPALGAGYDALNTTLTAVKRMDPLVFTGSVSHAFNQSTTVAGSRVEPGDTNSAAVRAILAASPDVSLRGGFSLARTGDTKVGGFTVPGSKQTAAMLELGTSIALSKRTLLDLTVGAGLTQDSPDLVVGVALPIRF
ncbi:MAG TPA: transporter [Burkholderiales bacterium]|nr:transporter [Burkholderiales bacterium]